MKAVRSGKFDVECVDGDAVDDVASPTVSTSFIVVVD